MLANTRKKRLCSLYKPNQLSKPYRTIDRFSVYENIRSGEYKQATEFIQEKYKDCFGEEASEEKPDLYQSDKKRVSPAAVFSGIVDRHNKTFESFGIINLDIDEGTKQELNKFEKLVRTGKYKFVEALAGSVSHPFTGSLWMNAKIQMPTSYAQIPERLKILLDLPSDDLQAANKRILKGYHAYLTNEFKKVGTKVASSKDFSRVRYLTHFPEIYIREHATAITLHQLTESSISIKKEDRKQKSTRKHQSIQDTANLRVIAEAQKTQDPFKIAEAVALEYIGEFKSGARHHFQNTMAIVLNLLGVPEKSAYHYINKHYKRTDQYTNAVRYPYENYAENHGLWSDLWQDKLVNVLRRFIVKKGEFMSKYAPKLIELYRERFEAMHIPTFDILGGTSIGKSWATVNKIAPEISAMTGCKSIIIFPLNALTAKQASSYKRKFVTMEEMNKKGGLSLSKIWDTENVILCNQDSFKTIADYARSRQERLNIFIDESHTIVNFCGFKPQTINEFWRAVNIIARSITLYSGTPKPYFQTLGYERIEFLRESRSAINVEIRLISKNSNKVKTAITHIIKTDFSDNKIVLLKLQSKRKLQQIQKALLKKGYTKEQVIVIASDKRIKARKYYQNIIDATEENPSFSPEVKVVLTTSAINCGLDIYSDRPLQAINIESTKNVNFEAFVQFVDRWRTVEEKTVISYHLAPQEARIRSFNALHHFKKQKAAADKEATFMTSGYHAGIFSSDVEHFNLSSSLNTAQRTFYLDGDLQCFKSNDLLIMHEADKRLTQTIDVFKFAGILRTDFDYFNVIFEVLGTTEEETPKAILEAQKKKEQAKHVESVEVVEVLAVLEAQTQKDKEEKVNQEIVLHQLLINDFEKVVGAAWHLTQDRTLKQVIREKYSGQSQTDIEPFIGKYQILFDEYLGKVEQAIKRVFHLETFCFSRLDIIGKLIFETGKDGFKKLKHTNKYNEFQHPFIILFGFSLDSTENDIGKYLLTYRQQRDVTQHKRIVDDVLQALEDRSKTGQSEVDVHLFRIRDLVKIVRKRKRGLSYQQALKTLNALFVFDKDDDKKKCLRFVSRRDLHKLLTGVEIDCWAHAKNVRKLLNINI